MGRLSKRKEIKRLRLALKASEERASHLLAECRRLDPHYDIRVMFGAYIVPPIYDRVIVNMELPEPNDPKVT